MKIVVTGALGHIGSKLIREIPDFVDQPEIVMIDNMMTQRYPSLFNLSKKATYNFVEENINNIDLSILLKGVDVVVHLAAITDAASSFTNADVVEENNFNSTKNLATVCADLGVPLFFPSSTSVYGTQKELVDENCSEEDLKPQSPYAITKLREEAVVKELAETRGLQHITCRLGTIFGTSPGMRFHTAVNKFCWQAAMGQPLTVWKTALDQKRPYLALDDAIRAISMILEKKLFDGRIYNILTCNSTVRNVVDTIKIFIPDVEITLVENQIMNQLSYEIGCDRIQAQGFKATDDLKTGVGATIKLLRNSNALNFNFRNK